MPRKISDTAIVDFTQSIGLLVRRVRAAAASYGLSWTESAVMARLSKGGPATTAELARAEAMKPQSMGTTIASLERRGMVIRKSHPTDGRQMNVELTSKGAAVRKGAVDAKHTWIVQAVTALDEQEQQTLLKAGEIIRRLADK